MDGAHIFVGALAGANILIFGGLIVLLLWPSKPTPQEQVIGFNGRCKYDVVKTYRAYKLVSHHQNCGH